MTEETTLTNQPASKLLIAGIVAGPFFSVAALVHAFMRKGFNLIRHPASLLSLGDLGWIQIANFVITGALYIACGVGLKRVLTDGIGSKWAPRLFVIFGIALVIGGVFTADPGLGFPPGTPEGQPKEMSLHGTIHGFAPVLGFLALLVALIALARRFGSHGQRSLKIVTIIVAIGMFALSALPNFTADWEKGVFNFLPLWAGAVLGFCWTSFVIAMVRKENLIKK